MGWAKKTNQKQQNKPSPFSVSPRKADIKNKRSQAIMKGNSKQGQRAPENTQQKPIIMRNATPPSNNLGMQTQNKCQYSTWNGFVVYIISCTL